MTKFDYLLNAFEKASQHTEPADYGYAAKREALFAYVHDLEAAALSAAPPAPTPQIVAPVAALLDACVYAERVFRRGPDSTLDDELEALRRLRSALSAATAPTPLAVQACETTQIPNCWWCERVAEGERAHCPNHGFAAVPKAGEPT